MLTLFRSFAKSPFALVIILLIVLAFAFTGVGGIFTGSGTAVVVASPVNRPWNSVWASRCCSA
jgi:hypothetical protein